MTYAKRVDMIFGRGTRNDCRWGASSCVVSRSQILVWGVNLVNLVFGDHLALRNDIVEVVWDSRYHRRLNLLWKWSNYYWALSYEN